jgi:hypothetical protein
MKTTLKEAHRDRGTVHRDDRWKLFLALDTAFAPQRVLYPDCGRDVSPSLVFPDVTYIDARSAVAAFFDDIEGVLDLVAGCSTAPENAVFRFVRADRSRLVLPRARFDLVISLDARQGTESCADYLRVGGLYLTSRTGREAETLATAPGFVLAAIAVPVAGNYALRIIDTAPGSPDARKSDPARDGPGYSPQDLAVGAVSLLFRRIS